MLQIFSNGKKNCLFNLPVYHVRNFVWFICNLFNCDGPRSRENVLLYWICLFCGRNWILFAICVELLQGKLHIKLKPFVGFLMIFFCAVYKPKATFFQYCIVMSYKAAYKLSQHLIFSGFLSEFLSNYQISTNSFPRKLFFFGSWSAATIQGRKLFFFLLFCKHSSYECLQNSKKKQRIVSTETNFDFALSIYIIYMKYILHTYLHTYSLFY